MALQQHPEDYAEAKKELLQYWHEGESIVPVREFPFVWPESPHLEPGSPLDVKDSYSPFNFSLEETFDLLDDDAAHLTDFLAPSGNEDILNTGRTESLNLEFLLPRPRNGPDHFRKYGPASLKKAAISFPRGMLMGEDGMEIPRDTSDVFKAFKEEKKIRVTQQDADYLRSMISKISHENSIDIILPKVLP